MIPAEPTANEEISNPLDRVVMVARGVDAETGTLIEDEACSTNWTPVPVEAGDVISFAEGIAPHRLYFYQEREDEELSATYCYDDESNWTAYAPQYSQFEWSTVDFAAPASGFIRVSFQTGEYAGGRLGDYLQVTTYVGGPARYMEELAPILPAFAAEIDRVAQRVNELREPGDCVFLLISDIHHSIGDYWADTVRNLQACAERIDFDAVVQMGDVTDGIAPRAVTEQLVGEVIDPLRNLGAPLLGCLGNHDVNYFHGNAESLDTATSAKLCLGRSNPNYYHDIPSSQLRLIFLDSFDPQRKERYGYTRECVKWLRSTLRQTPKGWRVLAFSHVTPVAVHHYWSETIENGPRVIKALERFNRRRKGAVLGLIHGHNHADQLYWAGGIPIISEGCAKYEYFKEKKPAGAITPDRERGTVNQELWDVVVVKPKADRMEFVRFGAGESRSVSS